MASSQRAAPRARFRRPERLGRRGVARGGLRARRGGKPAARVGRDVSWAPRRRVEWLRPWIVPLATGLGSSLLLLAVLRNDIIELRYRLAAAQQEHRLLAREVQQRRVTARRLRHPLRLEGLAREMGLGPIPRIELAPGRARAEPPR